VALLADDTGFLLATRDQGVISTRWLAAAGGPPGPEHLVDGASSPDGGLALVRTPTGATLVWNALGEVFARPLLADGAEAGPTVNLGHTGTPLDGAGTLGALDLGAGHLGDLIFAVTPAGLATAILGEALGLVGATTTTLAGDFGRTAFVPRAALLPSGRAIIAWSAYDAAPALRAQRLRWVVVEP
jgi:hypothetical protein